MSTNAATIVRRSRSNLAFALACLPKQRRQDMYVFYAFCRVVDDLADDEGLAVEERRAGLARWSDVIHGRAPQPNELESAVAAVQQRYAVPAAEMDEIIAGVSMDLEPRRYANWDELKLYCHRVAGCVGLVSTRIFGCQAPQSRDYALALGNALQLTNILRDIHGDYQNGRRIYLPQDEMAAAGVTEDDIARGQLTGPFLQLMAQQIARARRCYNEAESLVTKQDRIPLLASEAMRRIYSETLDLIEKDGCRVFDQRYSLPKWRKAQIVAGAWLRGLYSRVLEQKAAKAAKA